MSVLGNTGHNARMPHIFVAGYGVVIVKNGQRICGTGAALANAPIVQNKAYFEAKLQSSGDWFSHDHLCLSCTVVTFHPHEAVCV